MAVTVARYLEQQERFCPEPSIRVTVSASLSSADIDDAIGALLHAFQQLL